MDLLVLADSDGVVDMTPEAISRRTNVPLQQVARYIKELCQPDSASRSKMEDGKRLIPVDPARDWGWRIVNYRHYRQIRDEEARRSYFRDQKRKQRKKSVKDKLVDTGGRCQTVPSASASTSSLKKGDSKGGRVEIPIELKSTEGFSDEWGHFIEHRKQKKAPMTDHAQELFLSTLSQRPAEAVDAVKTAIMRNWTGFKWDWFDNHRSNNGARPNARPMSAFEIEKRISAINDRINLLWREDKAKHASEIKTLKADREQLKGQLAHA